MLSLPKALILARNVSHDFYCSMNGKRIYQTEAVQAFAASMSPLSRRKYLRALHTLGLFGYLRMPEAEKVEGQDNLFEIRIITDGNERFFYCYDAGTTVYVVHAFAKRTRKTPPREIATAIAIRNELLGGAV